MEARDENDLADRLTNEDFSQVSLDKRISCNWSDFDFSLFFLLWNERREFLDRDQMRAMATPFKDDKSFEKSAW